MPATATSHSAQTIVPPTRMAMGLFEKMLREIPAEKFARKPQGVNMNHPAWILGHLSIYPDYVVESVGRKELAEPDEAMTALCKDGTECRDDADGSIYPSKDALIDRFLSRMNTALDAIERTDDAVLAGPNTMFGQESMPTLGALLNFLTAHHMMMHMGQVSAWRRMMGMGPAM